MTAAMAATAATSPARSRVTLAELARTPWLQFALRRSGGLLLSIGVLVAMTFLIVPLIPGDPARIVLGPDATQAQVDALRSQLGLNAPLWMQFLDYLRGVFTWNLGESYRYHIAVTAAVSARIPYTLTLALCAIAIVIAVAIPLGMLIGVLTRGGRRPWLATGFSALAGFLAACPSYVVGTIFVVVFAIGLKWFPTGGATEPGFLVLPVVAVALGPAFGVARVVRQETLGVLRQDFIRTARGHRVSAARIYLRHALPNLMASTLTLTGLILSSLVGGAIIIETVFNLPGLGLEIVQSIIHRDFPMIRGIILIVGLVAISINLLIDIILGVIDPRTLGRAAHG